MHPQIIEAVKERYQTDPKAIRQARSSGTFELILVALGQYDLLRKIAQSMKPQEDCHEK